MNNITLKYKKTVLFIRKTTIIFSSILALTSPLSVKASDDAALMVEAVRAERIDVIKMLVEKGGDINAAKRGDGTPLMIAIKRGDIDMVKALLLLKADPNRISTGDGNPLIVAAVNDEIAIAKLLLAAGADVNALVYADETPLINAARSDHLSMVTLFVENGADLNLGVKVKTHDGVKWRSPLNQAKSSAVRQYLVAKGAKAKLENK